MKKLLIIALVLWKLPVQAQFLGGFFSQQATKKQLMVQQIAGYQLYLGALRTGYQISQGGLKSATDLKGGTFGLHGNYITSLLEVASPIADDPKVKHIDSLQRQIEEKLGSELAWQQKQQLLTAKELSYFSSVRASLLDKCQADRRELDQVLSPGKLELTDAERCARISKIDERMKDKLAFANYFTAKCRKLALARQRAKADKGQMQKLYGIH